MNLKDMVGGALQQKFQNSFERVMENMQDENTPYKDKRQITITMTFVQNEQRDDVVCDIAVKEKLAMQGGLKTHFSVGKDLRTDKVARQTANSVIESAIALVLAATHDELGLTAEQAKAIKRRTDRYSKYLMSGSIGKDVPIKSLRSDGIELRFVIAEKDDEEDNMLQEM